MTNPLIEFRTPTPRDWKVSPSQISMFDDSTDEGCQRKWGFRYIDKIKPPDLQSAIRGKEVHKELERYFLGGEINHKSLPGKLAGKILIHLQAAINLRNRFGALQYVETKNVIWYDGVFYNFTIDLIYPEPDMLVVSDHKTSKDPEEYGCTPATLPDDPQGIIYSFFPLEVFDIPVVRLQWTYVRTQAPKPPKKAPASFPVRVEIAREEARGKMQRVHKIAQRIVHAKATYTKGSDLPPNPKACSAFGGCKYIEFCNLTIEQKIQSVFKIDTTRKRERMGLKANLEQKRRMAPPRPEQLQNWSPSQINSPEAPSPEVAHRVAETISHFRGNKNQKQENALNVATAAYGAQSPQEADERIQSFQPQVQQMNPNFNPSENPSQQELVARVSSGITNWTSVRNKATPQIPFVHGKTLNTAKEQGLLDFNRNGQSYTIWLMQGGGQPTQQAPMQYQQPQQQASSQLQPQTPLQPYQPPQGGGQPQPQYQPPPSGMVPATSPFPQGAYQQPSQQPGGGQPLQQAPMQYQQPQQQWQDWQGAQWAIPGNNQRGMMNQAEMGEVLQAAPGQIAPGQQPVYQSTASPTQQEPSDLSREEYLSAFIRLVSASLSAGHTCEQAIREADKAIEAIWQRLNTNGV